MNNSLHRLAATAGLLWRSSGRETAAATVILLIRSVLPAAVLLMIRQLAAPVESDITAGGAGWAPAAAMMAMTVVGAMLADDLLSAAGGYIAKKQAALVEKHIAGLIHGRSAQLGLRFFDDPVFHDRLSRASADISWRPAAILSGAMMMARGVLSFLSMCWVLRGFGILPLAIAAALFIPSLLIRMKESGDLYRARKESTRSARQAGYFSWLLTGEKPAREVRLFGLGPFFRARFSRSFDLAKEPELAVHRRNAANDVLASLFRAGAFCCVLLYALKSFKGSAYTAGELAVYLVALRQAAVYLRDTVTSAAGLRENRLFLDDLFTFIGTADDTPGRGAAILPGEFEELRAEKISFTYPGATGPALKDVSLTVRKGEKIAIVGRNGSGKTTLAKLLCRLYEPDTGCLTFNGMRADTIDPDTYRRFFSVVFQDFMLYYLTAGENISLAEGQSDPGRQRTERAAGKAGLGDLLSGLPGGYDTPLGHQAGEGSELSWGEWQKIAIARALYREAPLLILDEPSSSLDADSEYEILSDLDRICGDRTAILISHRMSYARRADRIIVMDKGSVAESGSHDELMALGGRYFGMFNRQKSMYS